MRAASLFRLPAFWGHSRRTPGRSRKTRRSERSASAADRKDGGMTLLFPALVMAVVWVVASSSITYHPAGPTFQYVVGQTAHQSVYSEVPFEYEDLSQTRRLREQVEDREPPIWRIDHSATDSSLAALRQLATIIAARVARPDSADPSAPSDEQHETEPGQLLGGLSETCVTGLEYIVASRERWKLLERLVAEALRAGIASQSDMDSLIEGTPAFTNVYVVDDASDASRKSVCPAANLRTPTRASRI